MSEQTGGAAADRQLTILRMDERLVWVDKPSGLLSVPGLGEWNQDSVVTRLQKQWGGWFKEAHRLDRDTSGVMLVARDADAHREISRQFRERQVTKEYIAIVAGHVSAESGTIDLPIRADLDRRPWQIVDLEHGRPSKTAYMILARLLDSERRAVTRLQLTPLTGRTHQLRLHLAHQGHAILGDDLYAPPEVHGMGSRLMLHASVLETDDLAGGGRIVIQAECPF